MKERLVTGILFIQVLSEDHRNRHLSYIQVAVLLTLAISITVLIGRAVDALPQR